jgi:hypothetical protein
VNVFNQIHSKERLVQFVAQEIDLQNKYEITINDSLRLLIFDTELLGERKVEEMGKFYLFPIEDGRFYVELWYFYIDSENKINQLLTCVLKNINSYELLYFPKFIANDEESLLKELIIFSYIAKQDLKYIIMKRNIQTIKEFQSALE